MMSAGRIGGNEFQFDTPTGENVKNSFIYAGGGAPSSGVGGATPMSRFGTGMGQGQLGEAMQDIAEEKDPYLAESDVLPAVVNPPIVDKEHNFLVGVSNPSRPWESVPLVLGVVPKVPAYVSANPWLAFSGINNSTLRVGMDFCYGLVDISDIKVGEIPIDDLDPGNFPMRPAVTYNVVGNFHAGNSVEIADCDTAWTASTSDVVCSTDTTNKKEGTASALISLKTAFTTGKAAHFPTGTLDLEDCSTLTFWIYCTKRVGKNKLSFDLCSDVDGDDVIINLPFKTVIKPKVWTLITLSLSGGFGPTPIESIALRALADPGTRNIQLDYIFASKSDDGEDFQLYDSDIKQIDKDMSYNDAMVERCGQVADEITVVLSFPNGLYSQTTDLGTGFQTLADSTVTIKVESRQIQDTGAWTVEDPSWDITHNTANPFLVALKLSMDARDRYDIRITRLTTIGDDANTFNRCQWFALQSVILEEPYPKDMLGADSAPAFPARIELAATATNQLQGTLEPVTATIKTYTQSFQPNMGIIPIFYQINDNVGEGEEIVDSAGYTFANNYHNVNAILNLNSGSWSGSPPYRLTFAGDTSLDVSTDYKPLNLTAGSTTFSGTFVANGTTSPNPIFSCNSFFVFQDPTNGDVTLWASGLGDGDGESLTLTGVADNSDERKFSVLVNVNADETTTFTLTIFDSDDTVLATDSLTPDFFNGNRSNSRLTIGASDEIDPDYLATEQFFYGQIWDFRVTEIQASPFAGEIIGSQVDNAVMAAANNPALIALHVMRSTSFNPRPIPDSRINLQSFYDWSSIGVIRTFTYDKYIDQPMLLYDLLQEIGRCGRAKIVKKNGLYTAVMDVSKEVTAAPVVQHFSPVNTHSFRYRCERLKKIHAMRVAYIDKDTRERVEAIAYNTPYDEDTAIYYAAASLEGAGTEEEAIAYGKYEIAKWEKQQAKTVELQTDWEGLVCAEDDLVEWSHDAALVGIASGYVFNSILDGSDVVGIEVEQGCTFEDGKDYAVRLRKQTNGATVLVDVENPGAGIYNELIFSAPNPDGDYEFIDDHYQFGEQGLETKLMKVLQVDRLPDHAARILLKEYNEEIYEFEEDDEAELSAYASTATPVIAYQFIPETPEITSITDDTVSITVTLDTVSTSDVKWLQVQYKKDTDTQWISVNATPNGGAPTAITLTESIVASETYDIRARCLSFASVASDWTATDTHTV